MKFTDQDVPTPKGWSGGKDASLIAQPDGRIGVDVDDEDNPPLSRIRNPREV